MDCFYINDYGINHFQNEWNNVYKFQLNEYYINTFENTNDKIFFDTFSEKYSNTINIHKLILDYVSTVHFNPNIPQNMNFRVKYQRDNTIEVMENGNDITYEWNKYKFRDFLQKLYAKIKKRVCEYIIKNKVNEHFLHLFETINVDTKENHKRIDLLLANKNKYITAFKRMSTICRKRNQKKSNNKYN